MTQVCEGLRVIDFSEGMAGGVAGMVLADNGAEVVKVEPPGGDAARALPAFRQWGRGKRSVVLDLRSARGREQAQGLAASADVVLQTWRPGVAERLGLSYEVLSAANPGLVHCAISGFGEQGPYARFKGYEGAVQAKSGRMMDFQGQIAREGPIYAAVPVGSFAAAQLALQGILAALYVRGRSGRGQRVTTSLLQGISCYDMFNWLSLQLYGRHPDVFPTPYLMMGPSYHYLVAPTADGRWLQFANAASRLFRAFGRAVGLEDEFEAAGLLDGGLIAGRKANQDLWEVLLFRLQEKTLDEWMAVFDGELDVSVERFRSAEEAMSHPQALHNGDVVTVLARDGTAERQVGPLIRFSETPSSIRGPAPSLGADTEEILRAPVAPRGVVPSPAAALPKHALEGVTVLELAGFFAAPFGATLLADLGARVIKVEPLEGDPIRPLQGSTKTVQGKESIALDLKQPEARGVLHRLVARADVLMHNYRPGVPERLAMDYTTLSAVNPRLVYVYAGSYGSTGPCALRPAFHPTFGAISGGVLRQSGAGTPPPAAAALTHDDVRRISASLARANEGNPDPNSAVVVGTALLMGLYARERSGRGQYIETTMLCSNLWANSEHVIGYEGKPEPAIPDAGLHGLSALYRLYRCREGWVFVAAPQEREWRALAKEAGRPELLADERFSTAEARRSNDGTLSAALEGVFAGRTAAEWEEALAKRDVSCVVADAGRYADFFANDPQIEANGMSVEVVHPTWGGYRRHTPGCELSLTPGRVGHGFRVGENTRAILAELGYGAEEVASLLAGAVAGSP